MAKYKTTEQVREELAQIDPKYIDLYEITQNSAGIYLTREMATAIAFVPSTVGGHAGKYEVRPNVMGMNLEELFGMKDTVIGNLTLKEAVTIAEHAVAARHSPLFKPKLEEVIKEIQQKPIFSSFPIGMHR